MSLCSAIWSYLNPLFSKKYSSHKIAIFIFNLTLFISGCSQDIHFSQYNLSPLNLNPALTGAFNGDYRFVGNHRRQWASVTTPYQTFGVSAEARSVLKKLPNLSGGLAIYTDKAGDSQFTTTQINISGAYRVRVSTDSTQYITLGIQSGATERKLNPNKLSFDSQYNGNYYDPSLSNNEAFSQQKRSYPNLNLGLIYTKKLTERNHISAGLSWFNVSKPKQSIDGNNFVKLDRRLDFNGLVQFKMAEKIDLIPSFRIMGQGLFREIIVGADIKYILSAENYKYRAVYLGGWYRTGDAGFASVGMDYNSWHVGVSYDFNLSNLRPASNGRGGFEIAVIYILQNLMPNRANYKVCPNYI